VGLNVEDLNISNSLSYGVQILHSTLSNAVMKQVNVRTYALGVPPYHPQDPWPHHTNYCDGVYGVLAADSTIGSINVSKLSVNGTNIIAVQTNAYSTDCINKSRRFTFTGLRTNYAGAGPARDAAVAPPQRANAGDMAGIPVLVDKEK
jgi:hypothetical protein